MKNLIFCLGLILAAGMLVACAAQSSFHKEKMPDPKSFNAHFPDMDADGDDLVNWAEFKDYFPQADPMVFKAVDLNEDENINHDEWHQFKEAHGLEHKE